MTKWRATKWRRQNGATTKWRDDIFFSVLFTCLVYYY